MKQYTSSLLIIMFLLSIGLLTGIPVQSQNNVFLINTFVDSQDYMRYLVIYYGLLDYSSLGIVPPDILIFAGTSDNLNSSVLTSLRQNNTQVYAYLHDSNDNPVGLGSSFYNYVVVDGNTLDDWIQYIEGIIDRYVGKVDGVFFDEVDPGYFTDNPDPSNSLIQEFTQGLESIVSYAHQNGLQVIINGVRAYADLGDYYLWEGWCSTFDENQDNSYMYVSWFYQSSGDDNNPYVWVNDYAKLEYLEENNLISKTLAVSNGPIFDYDRMNTCYASALIAGFYAWGYADRYFYASTGGPPNIYGYSMGPAHGPGVFDSYNSTMMRMFYAGKIKVDIGSSWRVTYYNLTISIPASSGLNYTFPHDASPGLDIIGAILYQDGYGVSISVTLDNSFSGKALHIYIDTDYSQGTGYSNPSAGIEGADVLVEAIPPYSVNIYTYTGDGQSWSWSKAGQGYMESHSSYINVSIPYHTESGRLRIATLDQNWALADIEPGDNSPPLEISNNKYSIPLYALHTALAHNYNGIAIITKGTGEDSIVIYALSNYYSLLQFSTDAPISRITQTVDHVTTPLYEARSLAELDEYNGAAFFYAKYGDVYKVTIKAGPHASPVSLDVDYNTENLGVFNWHINTTEIIAFTLSIAMIIIFILNRCYLHR